MMSILNIYKLITGSKFIWKVFRNWAVLSEAFSTISKTLVKIHEEGRKLPDQSESTQLLLCLSNIVKTEIIDIPGVDEYELSLEIDKFSTSLLMSIEDKKSGKFHQVMITEKKDK